MKLLKKMGQFLGIIAPLACQSASKPPVAASERPNIIFILTDDEPFRSFNFLPEGRDCAGEPKNLMPNIDRLAEQGVILKRLHSPSPLCVPSRYNCLTGHYASRATNSWMRKLHKLHGHTFIHQEPKITEDTPTLGKRMQALGYRTGFVGKNHVIKVPGFDPIHTDEELHDPAVQRRLEGNTERVHRAIRAAGFDFVDRIYPGNPEVGVPAALAVHNQEWVTEGALEFIRRNEDQPFFLFYASTIAHGNKDIWKGNPLATQEGMLERSPQVQAARHTIPKRLQDAGLPMDRANKLWLDDSIGAILRQLETSGLIGHTIIFYATDHGIEGGKTTCYQGGMHTVGFVWGPEGYVKGGRESESLCSLIDFAPTIYHYAAGDGPPDGMFDGGSLKPLLLGESDEIHEAIFGEIGHTRTVIKWPYKFMALRYSDYITNMGIEERQLWLDEASKYMISTGARPFTDNDPAGPFGHSGYIPDGWWHEKRGMKIQPHYFDADQLYNLSVDPTEQNNLAGKPEYKEILTNLKNLLRRHLEGLPGGFAEFKPDPYRDIPKEERDAIARYLREAVFH